MISDTVSPSSLSSLIFCTTSAVKIGLGPNLTPLALALLIPSCWRSLRMSFLELSNQGEDTNDQLTGPRSSVDAWVINNFEGDPSLGKV